jgi:hypothetical protein
MQSCPHIFPDDDQEYEVSHTRNGELHRDPKQGPAYIHADQSYITEKYYWNGHLHREDGPAERWWNRDTGKPFREVYWWHDQVHRDPSEGPASRVFYQGVVEYEKFCLRGKIYRDPSEGPSRIWRDAQGNICRVRHSVRKDLTKAKEMLALAAKRASKLPRVRSRRRFLAARQTPARVP